MKAQGQHLSVLRCISSLNTVASGSSAPSGFPLPAQEAPIDLWLNRQQAFQVLSVASA